MNQNHVTNNWVHGMAIHDIEHMAEHINKKFGVKVELIHREQNIEQTFERTL